MRPIIFVIFFLGIFLAGAQVFKVIQAQNQSIQTIALEPESGQLSGPVTVGDDPDASGGKYIQFGSTPSNTRVHIFYYGWYRNLTTDKRWTNWEQNGHNPPDDIASNFYPQLGAYSENDQAAVAKHMEWIKQSGAGVLVFSWHGIGHPNNQPIQLVLDEAAKQNLKVAWHIESYAGRTINSVEADIKYIYDNYASHPAFFKTSRPTKYGNTTADRGVFYAFESSGGPGAIPASDWRTLLDKLHSDPKYNPIVLGETTDGCYIDGCNNLNTESHFDGLYSYDGLGYDGSSFADINNEMKIRNSIFSPSVAPGYIAQRATGDTRIKPRVNSSPSCPGYTYDCMWNYAVNAKPEWVSITSFNEWHEGTQIEPAVPKTISGFTYEDYNDFDTDAQSEIYLQKTMENIQKYTAVANQLAQKPQGSIAGSFSANFTTAADTFVYEASPSANFGKRKTLEVDNSPSIKRALIRFKIANLPTDAAITTATLRLFVANFSKESGDVYKVDGNWEELTAAWNNTPPIGAKIADISNPANVGTWVSADVKSAVTGNGDVNFYVASPSNDGVFYNSKETGSNPPNLVIEYTSDAGPAPSPTPIPTPAPTPTPIPTPIPSPAHYLTPPPISATDPIIAAAGDIACGAESTSGSCKQMATSDLLLQINPSAVLALGDTQYEFGQYSNFSNFYHPAWGRVKDKTYPAVGNHEYGDSVGSANTVPDCDVSISGDPKSYACGYFDYYNGKGSFGGRAGDRGKGYYAVDIGSWRIYAINSNCTRTGAPTCAGGSDQEKWLRADLTVNPRSCTLMYMHHPFSSSDTRDFDKTASTVQLTDLYKAFYEAGGDVVLAGHSHFYERFAKQNSDRVADPAGFRLFVVGTGGRNVYALDSTEIRANHEVGNGASFGVLKLTLHDNSYDWQFVPIAGQTFNDSGNDSCGGLGGPLPTPMPTPTPTPAPAETPGQCPAVPTDKGVAAASFSVPEQGDYKIWSRIMVTGNSSNSYWLEVDDNCAINAGDLTDTLSNTWLWTDYQKGQTDSKINFTLKEGDHTLKLIGKETGLKLDRIILTKDLACSPVGIGDNCGVVIILQPSPEPPQGGEIPQPVDEGVPSSPEPPQENRGGGGGGGGSSNGGGGGGAPQAVSSASSKAHKRGDVNGDGLINILDFSIILSRWNKSSGIGTADLNGNGRVDIIDLSILLSNWGK